MPFGENKVQEAEEKWSQILKLIKNLKIHMVGKLQSNKAKKAINIFSFIHSLDNPKLADVCKKSEEELNKKISYFIQVNIGNEISKIWGTNERCEKFFKILLSRK